MMLVDFGGAFAASSGTCARPRSPNCLVLSFTAGGRLDKEGRDSEDQTNKSETIFICTDAFKHQDT